MKDQIYLAKAESLLNNPVQQSEQHILKLSAWHDEVDQRWTYQNLILKDHDQFNEEKIKRELAKDKEWLEVVEENRKLQLEISRKLENIRTLTSTLPSDISEFSRCISQLPQNEEQIRKNVLKRMTEDMAFSYNQVRLAQQTSAQF